MSNGNVLRANPAEEERLYRRAVNETISRILAAEQGRTLIDIAEAIGVEGKTISNAFNMKHSLSPLFLSRLGQVYGAEYLDPFAALSGARMLPLPRNGEKDVLPFIARASLKIIEARDPDSPSGGRETHREQADYLPDLRALRRELDLLIARIEGKLAA